jgi:hypothetical protein
MSDPGGQNDPTNPDKLKDIPWFVAGMFILVGMAVYGCYKFVDWQVDKSKPRGPGVQVIRGPAEPLKP